QGSINLYNGGTNSGTILVAAGATATLDGPCTLTPTSHISGPRNVTFKSRIIHVLRSYHVSATTVNGRNAQFATDVPFDSLPLTAGTLTGKGNMPVTGSFAWTGGIMSGTGRTFLISGVNFSGTGAAGPPTLDGRTVDNAGTATWTGTVDLAFNSGA